MQAKFILLIAYDEYGALSTEKFAIVNSNFIDSGATMDGVSPSFCSANNLWEHVVDHDEPMEITLAGKQTMTLPTRTIPLTVYMEKFTPYTNDFLVIDVPEGKTFSWSVNPDINWVSERVKPRVQQDYRKLEEISSRPKTNKKRERVRTSHKPVQPALPIGGKRRSRSPQRKRSLSDYFSTGYYSAVSGTTKYITSKQFRRMLKKPSKIECIFTQNRKKCGRTEEPVDIESFRDHPVFALLLKHKELYKQKLPMDLPPHEHGEHVMEVDTKEAVFRRQWRQSPSQEKVIMDWVRELRKAGLIRTSTSPHGAPTFCVKKPVGWRIVHDYRAMNSHTVRRTLPMPRRDSIIEKMQGAFWYSCIDLLSGYYQFRMRDCDVPFTAFQTPDGAYEYLVLPMGLSNAPATFNDGIRRILSDLSEICQCYFDDIYIYTKSKSVEDHLTALD
ncbi:LOW QUALITY PROTEIN: hypothetical protein PHMEG_00037525 [Phytophthora megakarya]|uniref:Reverse transcriptase domain-containing protein n=1 Tax=Phytophthora megakarya TaxID=4795 RepID=A0A225UKV1_9STRA|nr:LOW QUALITY PROTEIN: hypothetical protein PHMEG_00037525 [Phytophthora megakarya]